MKADWNVLFVIDMGFLVLLYLEKSKSNVLINEIDALKKEISNKCKNFGEDISDKYVGLGSEVLGKYKNLGDKISSKYITVKNDTKSVYKMMLDEKGL